MEEMLADYYAHHYFDDPKAADEIEDDDFNPDDVARLTSRKPPADDFENLE